MLGEFRRACMSVFVRSILAQEGVFSWPRIALAWSPQGYSFLPSSELLRFHKRLARSTSRMRLPFGSEECIRPELRFILSRACAALPGSIQREVPVVFGPSGRFACRIFWFGLHSHSSQGILFSASRECMQEVCGSGKTKCPKQ